MDLNLKNDPDPVPAESEIVDPVDHFLSTSS